MDANPLNWHAVLQWLDAGLLGWSGWQIAAFTAAATHLTIIAVTVYLHRCQAHRALDLHPAVSHLLRLWLWLSTGMVTREWVAVHRKHHACCERAGDPHSPQVFGIGKVLLEGAELYQIQARDLEAVRRYGRGVPDDWLERRVYGRLRWQGVALLLIADLALFGIIGLSVWAVQMLWIPVCAAGIINGIGHYAGYRSFDGPTAAANIVPWGVLIGGEELHGNHHAFPTSARLSVRWFELDIGWLYIRLLAMLGLARIRATAPSARWPQGPDTARLEAIIAGRLHVLRAYGRMTVRVWRDELRAAHAGKLPRGRARRHAERLLRRDPAYLNGEQRAALAALLGRHRALAQTLHLRAELCRLWDTADLSAAQALARLAAWRDHARRSGVPALQAFAGTL